MKRTSEEIITTLKEHEEALGDSFLGLLEDIADSVGAEAPAPDYSGYVKKEEYDELKQKYIDRFTNKPPEKPNPEPEKKDPEISIDDIIDGLA